MYQENCNEKSTPRRRRSALRVALMTFMACVMIFSAIGGTLSWLMTSTTPIVNVFTYGGISISLTETTGTVMSDGRYFKMTPGKDIAKDPKITVDADSEDCWLFVKIVEGNALSDFISYTLTNEWTALDGVSGVYYCEVSSSTADQTFSVLADNKVSVRGSVTLGMLQALSSTTYPTMTVTAYAVQRDAGIADIDTAAEAWALVSGS